MLLPIVLKAGQSIEASRLILAALSSAIVAGLAARAKRAADEDVDAAEQSAE